MNLRATLAGMDRDLVSEKLWEIIEPLLPSEPSKDKGGRPRITARAVLCGIIYVLKAGIPWRRLPKQLGYGSGVTCWRRLRDWQKAGVFVLLFRNLLDRLGRCGAINWSRAGVDSATVPTKKGARRSGLILPIVASRAPNATC
jgi:transposase